MTTQLGRITPTLGLAEGASLGLGFLRQPVVPNPGAGNLPTFSFPGGETARLLSFAATVTTSATVANRQLALRMLDQDGSVVWSAPLSASIVASAAILASWQIGFGAAFAGANGDLVAGVPDMLVLGGYSLAMVATGFQAGDTVTKIKMLNEAYPVGALGYPTGSNYLPAGG